jgi:hypothetical protein
MNDHSIRLSVKFGEIPNAKKYTGIRKKEKGIRR